VTSHVLSHVTKILQGPTNLTVSRSGRQIRHTGHCRQTSAAFSNLLESQNLLRELSSQHPSLSQQAQKMFRLLPRRRALKLTLRPRVSTPAIPLAPRRAFATHPPPSEYPSPPRLPPEEQAEFERLQKQVMEKLASEEPPPSAAAAQGQASNAKDPFFTNAEPEFQGDVNPRTGEAGGPKNEPLRWGEKGDWSYNGKVTDF
jgi:uncharacterized protein DUF1674